MGRSKVTKKALVGRCRDILHGAPVMSEITGPDRDFLLRVLRHHPEYDTWPVEQGPVVKIVVSRADGSRFSTPCFYLHYGNGEVWLFSFHKCIGNMGSEHVEAVWSGDEASS